MKQVALIVVTTLSLAASYYVGSTYSEQRGNLQQNLCLTNTAIVSILQESVAQTTRADVERIGLKRWEKERQQVRAYVERFQDASPCRIAFTLPPDVALPSPKR